MRLILFGFQVSSFTRAVRKSSTSGFLKNKGHFYLHFFHNFAPAHFYRFQLTGCMDFRPYKILTDGNLA